MVYIEGENNQRLLKAADVANTLNISRALAYRLIRRGVIASVRINSAVRVRQADLDEFIRKSVVGADHEQTAWTP